MEYPIVGKSYTLAQIEQMGRGRWPRLWIWVISHPGNIARKAELWPALTNSPQDTFSITDALGNAADAKWEYLGPDAERDRYVCGVDTNRVLSHFEGVLLPAGEFYLFAKGRAGRMFPHLKCETELSCQIPGVTS